MTRSQHPQVVLAGRQHGLSLVELMISITIGLLLLTGLVSYFVQASTNQRETQRAAQQIENGRYAIETLTQSLQLTGFYGAWSAYSTPSSLPDPCDVASTTTIKAAMGLPVQGYQAGSLTARPTVSTNCATYLSSANLAAGSDVLVVRFLDTTPVSIGGSTSSSAVYVQTNPADALVQVGGGTLGCTTDALGAATSVTRKCSSPTTVDVCPTQCAAGTSPGGEVRQLITHIYFVAPCSIPSSGTTCTSTSDGGTPIPTLKRLELTATSFNVVSIAEGVEYMKLEFGVDTTRTDTTTGASLTTTNANTGKVGDGVPDNYTLTPALADYENTVSVRVDLLVRNAEKSTGYTDNKTYNLGVDPTVLTSPAWTITAPGDAYRRHVYAAEVRLVNLAGRKENP